MGLPAVTNDILAKERWEDLVKKAFIAARNVVGVAGLLLAGYVLLTSVRDIGRYVRISTM